jgi:hypothetical protein
LHCRGTQVLTEHRRQILGRLDGANERVARHRAEGGQHRGGIHHPFGGGHGGGFHGIGKVGELTPRQPRGVAGRFQHRLQPHERLLDRLLHRAHVLNIRGRSYRLRDLEESLKA